MKGKVTLTDIAQELGVSRSAVAKVILGTGGDKVRVAEKTRLRIEEAAKRMNYSPNRLAQQLRGVSSKTLGVILDTRNTPVMTERLFALEKEAAEAGYRLLIGQAHGQADTITDYVADFTGRAVEGIFCFFDLSPGRHHSLKTTFAGFENVIFHGRPAWPGGYCVKVDTAAAIRQTIAHLSERGYHKIALALWNLKQDDLMQLRQKVFLEELAKPEYSHLKPVVWDARSAGTNPEPTLLQEGIRAMVHEAGAEAIIASNDIWATRFILSLRKNETTRKVAVVGYDNLDISSIVSPTLTTIDQCHEEYAKAALSLMLRLAEKENIPPADRTLIIQPRLIPREST